MTQGGPCRPGEAILAASAEAYFVVKILGAAYLVFLGLHALLQSRRSAPRTAGFGVRVAAEAN
ncbi:hypothetical protein [Nonomuraea sp. B19D2]|uniref:hypothetical protein n=1 Tax=Nonomuraea sp. B19D2 TaxID=3159561 RepID=UPI0032DA533E